MMISAFFHFPQTLNELFKNCIKLITVLGAARAQVNLAAKTRDSPCSRVAATVALITETAKNVTFVSSLAVKLTLKFIARRR